MRPVLGVLDQYVMRAVLSGVAMVAAVLASLGALFLVIGQQNDIGVGNYTATSAAVFVLLSLPQQIWDLLPISALIGGLLGLGNLARGSELTVMRAAGWSVWRVSRGVVAAGVILLVIAVVLGEWLAPPMQQLAKQQKTLLKMAGQGGGTLGATWVRDGQLLVSVERGLGGRCVVRVGRTESTALDGAGNINQVRCRGPLAARSVCRNDAVERCPSDGAAQYYRAVLVEPQRRFLWRCSRFA